MNCKQWVARQHYTEQYLHKPWIPKLLTPHTSSSPNNEVIGSIHRVQVDYSKQGVPHYVGSAM